MSAASPQDADLIVVGSGMGGLTVASLATQLLGWRVLVLEKHWTAGGFTHAFSRGRWRWDVGLHYVSGVRPGSQSRRLFDLVTDGLDWTPLPDCFDVLHLPGRTIALPWREHEQAETLIKHFPAEAPAIRRYYKDVALVRRGLGPALYAASAPALLAWPLRLATLPAQRLASMGTGAYLANAFGDPALRLAIAARWGDYGLSPDESAFGLHAMVLGSYAEGAGRPVGGAPAIASAVSRILARTGGEIRTRCPVERIIVEQGRARGVRYRERDGEPHELRAPRVVSAAGAVATYRRLLDPALVPPALGRRIDELAPRGSAAVLYLGLRDDPAGIGLVGENHWIVDERAMHRSTETIDDVAAGKASMLFVSTAPGAVDGSFGPTAQVMVPMQHRAFEAWAGQPWRHRGEAYAATKQRIADGLLRQVDAQLPGLAGLTAHVEASTPLTVASMTSHPNGAIYGLAGTPARFSAPMGANTPIKGLWLAGADICTPGVQGALMGGIFATACLLGARGMPRIVGAAQRRA